MSDGHSRPCVMTKVVQEGGVLFPYFVFLLDETFFELGGEGGIGIGIVGGPRRSSSSRAGVGGHGERCVKKYLRMK